MPTSQYGLKTYIKLDMPFQVEDGVNSARKFLSVNKNKLSPQYLLRQRNFFNTIYNFCRLMPNNPTQKQALYDETEKILPTEITDKIWLLEIIKAK